MQAVPHNRKDGSRTVKNLPNMKPKKKNIYIYFINLKIIRAPPLENRRKTLIIYECPQNDVASLNKFKISAPSRQIIFSALKMQCVK